MNIVSFGGGTNSTAMLIGMFEKKIPVDLILFADTGAEKPETYDFIQLFSTWLEAHDMPKITVVENVDCNGNRFTLEQECLKSQTLPAIAYGYKKCSLKHKIAPQDKFCNNYKPCKDVWESGNKVIKYIGYDAGEETRIVNASIHDMQDTKFNKVYALYDWGWHREECIKKILEYGIPLPGKSSCFFCPSMKKAEIRLLRKEHPDLLERALALEENAKPNLITVKGLGRDWSWKNFIEMEKNQIVMCAMYDRDDPMACGCYDG